MKDNRNGLIMMVLSILVLTIGLTYAYYVAQVQGTGNTNAESSARTATLGEVEFNGETTFDSSTLEEIYPGFIGVQTFTISPYKDGSGIYEIDLASTVPAAFGSDIKLTLYKTSDAENNNITREEGTLTINNNQYTKQDTLTTTGTLEKVYDGTLSTTTQEILEQVEFNIASNAFVTPDTTPDGEYTYYAVYEYLDNGNQNEQQGLNFSSKITVRYILKSDMLGINYLKSLVASADPTSTEVIDNSEVLDGEEVLCTNTMAYDDYGNLRFVGANPCNYVTFNGEEPTKSYMYRVHANGDISTGSGRFGYNGGQEFPEESDCTSKIDSTISQIGTEATVTCELNSDTNKYYINAVGDLYTGGEWIDFETEELCQSRITSSSIGTSNVTCERSVVTYDGWRIIGIIDGKIKLIRTSIGNYSWDTSASGVNGGNGINQWGESGTYTGADLMKLLNPDYDRNLAEDSSGNAITGTYANNSLYWNKQSGNCYNGQNNAYTTCDFTSTGLTSEAKSMIAYSTWHLGSQGSNDVWTSGNGLGTSKKFYEYERSTNTGKICTSGSHCNDSVERTTTWEGYIGLMSPSDYGYAVGGTVRTTCLSDTNLNDYYNSGCYNEDWLNGGGLWTLSPRAPTNNAFNVFNVWNYVYSNGADVAYGVLPSLNLTSGVRINGSGTPNAPFTLSLD